MLLLNHHAYKADLIMFSLKRLCILELIAELHVLDTYGGIELVFFNRDAIYLSETVCRLPRTLLSAGITIWQPS